MINIEKNREDFIERITNALNNRAGSRIQEFMDWIENSDFFTAPASTKYHGAEEGGLCAHSLLVHDYLKKLCVDAFGENQTVISDTTIAIIALLHDLAKVNFYCVEPKNKKVYGPNGSKHDSLGNYDWVSELGYSVREDKFIFGTHEENSYRIASSFVPLTTAEAAAIINHHGFASGKNLNEVSVIFDTYPETLLLNQADMLAAHINKI